MDDILLPYGTRQLRVRLSGIKTPTVLNPRSAQVARSAVEMTTAALDSPIRTDPFDTLFPTRGRTTIVVPDKTRRCAAQLFLPLVLNRLNDRGIPDDDIQVLLANGSHAGHTREEIVAIVGADVARRIAIVEHDSKAEQHLVYLGETSFGTPVFVNRAVVACDYLLVAGTVVHHYFAGFGGGPKMIVPGCAGYETIRRNHALSIDGATGTLQAGCRPGNVAENPIQHDIREALQWVQVDFLIETVLDASGQVVAVFGGDLFEAHGQACAAVNELYKVRIPERADLVIASCGGHPKDINLIQAHKALFNAYQAVKPGGVIVLLAECSQGVGSETFLAWFDFEDDAEFKSAVKERFTLNATTAASLREKAGSVTIILVSSLLAALVSKLGMLPAQTIGEGLKAAADALPANYTSYIMPNGSLTLPKVEG